jgi:hypothetical protein
MKKVYIAILVFVTAVFGFGQDFDDLPYLNPDWATYFQQEMTSLMKFQAANNINVPFFISWSGSILIDSYNHDYLKSLYSEYPDYLGDVNDDGIYSRIESGMGKALVVQELVTGFQIKVNNSLYIPILFSFGVNVYQNILEEYTYTYGGTEYTTPVDASGHNFNIFAGSGVFINTDIIKGGIYLGFRGLDYGITAKSPVQVSGDFISIEDTGTMATNFSIALVPLINTSGWAYVGKALNSVLGYLGTGDTVMYLGDKEGGDSKAAALANALNAALDFTFNRMRLGSLALDTWIIYTRGNFDAVAKNDVYGAKIQGLFLGKPFGFSLEGGYKHFYSISKYFTQDYHDTGYFSGSIFFPFKKITFGFTYGYDDIYKSKFTVALSTNYLAGLMTNYDNNQLQDGNKVDKGDIFCDSWGTRFRWGGWNVGKK